MKTIVFFIFLLSQLAVAADFVGYEDLENLFERVARDNETVPSLEEIEFLVKNPIILSKTSPEDLLIIPGFSLLLTQRIVDLVQTHNITSYDSLKDSLGLTNEQLVLLRLCTRFVIEKNLRKDSFYYRLRSSSITSPTNMSLKDSKTGSKPSIYNRAEFYSKYVNCSAIFNKDAFEQSLTDYYSGWLDANIAGFNLILGDFYIESGMGSVLWGNYGLMKGSEVIAPVLQRGQGAKPFRSTIENLNFRGLCLSKNVEFDPLNVLKSRFWISAAPKSANIDEGGFVTSIYQTGLYRTETEARKYHTLNEKGFGANLEWLMPLFTIGANVFSLDYDKEIISQSKSIFNGRSGLLGSIYGFADFHNTSIGFEIAKDAKNSLGIKSSLAYYKKDYEFGFHFRHFPSEYRDPYSYNFGESSSLANETGFYSGFRWKSIKNIDLKVFIDINRGTEAGFNLDAPVRGIDIFTEMDWRINSYNTVILRLKNEEKTDAVKNSSNRNITIQKTRRIIRLEHIANISSKVSLRFRGECCFTDYDFAKKNEQGWAGFSEIRYSLNSNIAIGARYSLFDTGGYDEAIWQYESFIPGSMLSVPLYGSGMRMNLFFSARVFENLRIWGRYYETVKNNTNKSGNGLTEVLGNSDKRVSFQLDINF